jgi:hypothetical protein
MMALRYPAYVPFLIQNPLDFSNIVDTPPPSITSSENDGDIDVELIKKRYERARSPTEIWKYQEAIPHLRRTLDAIQVAGENPVFQDTTEAYRRILARLQATGVKCVHGPL